MTSLFCSEIRGEERKRSERASDCERDMRVDVTLARSRHGSKSEIFVTSHGQIFPVFVKMDESGIFLP